MWIIIYNTKLRKGLDCQNTVHFIVEYCIFLSSLIFFLYYILHQLSE